jgi:Ala-tRNA(Pro) deacylase
MRIVEFLTEQHVAYEELLHPPAFSAQKRAKYLHVPGNRVAKCVLFRGPAGHFLAVLPATHTADLNRLGAHLGGPIRLAGDSEMADLFRDCEWGVVPPFGILYGLPTVLDDSLPHDGVLIFEGHTHVEAIRIRCADFERLENPRRFAFAVKVD